MLRLSWKLYWSRHRVSRARRMIQAGRRIIIDEERRWASFLTPSRDRVPNIGRR